MGGSKYTWPICLSKSNNQMRLHDGNSVEKETKRSVIQNAGMSGGSNMYPRRTGVDDDDSKVVDDALEGDDVIKAEEDEDVNDGFDDRSPGGRCQRAV